MVKIKDKGFFLTTGRRKLTFLENISLIKYSGRFRKIISKIDIKGGKGGSGFQVSFHTKTKLLVVVN